MICLIVMVLPFRPLFSYNHALSIYTHYLEVSGTLSTLSQGVMKQIGRGMHELEAKVRDGNG